jgi:cell division protease FtsH
MIVEHRERLDVIAKALLEYETLDGEHIKEIMAHGDLKNPPAAKPPVRPSDDEPVEEPPALEPVKADEGDYTEGLEGAPAGA